MEFGAWGHDEGDGGADLRRRLAEDAAADAALAALGLDAERYEWQEQEEQEVLKDLRSAGCSIDGDLQRLLGVASAADLKAACEVVAAWLPRARAPMVRESLAFLLAGAHGRGAAEVLLTQFVVTPQHHTVRRAIATAVARMAHPSLAAQSERLVEAACDERWGRDRQSLVEALGKVGTPETVAAAVAFLDDPWFQFAALKGLAAGRGSVPAAQLDAIDTASSADLRRLVEKVRAQSVKT